LRRLIINQSVIPNCDISFVQLENSSSGNLLGIHGSYIQKILESLDENNKRKSIAMSYFSSFNGRKSLLTRTNACEINRNIFDPIESLVVRVLEERHFLDFQQSADWHRYHQFVAILAQMQHNPPTRKINCNDDFFILRLIGKGGFGMVYACKKSNTGKLYALKQMCKRRIKVKRCESLVLLEQRILSQVQSPFIVNLIYSFDSEGELYLVLDLMVGGDLRFHLNLKNHFTLEESKFYAARMILAISILHEKCFIHRDLKPENVLLDIHGNSKLSDFGLAAYVPPEGLGKKCGTLGYWAPEMLSLNVNGKYSLVADWFSFGVSFLF
jgi:tRNA A-37 threonylcarbamoyl transferase component Bud32